MCLQWGIKRFVIFDHKYNNSLTNIQREHSVLCFFCQAKPTSSASSLQSTQASKSVSNQSTNHFMHTAMSLQQISSRDIRAAEPKVVNLTGQTKLCKERLSSPGMSSDDAQDLWGGQLDFNKILTAANCSAAGNLRPSSGYQRGQRSSILNILILSLWNGLQWRLVSEANWSYFHANQTVWFRLFYQIG